MPYPAYPGPYATADDLAGYWRALTSAEQSRATVLLGAVADRINEYPNAANFVNTACHWVSLQAVKRAMQVSGDGEKSESQSMLGMSIERTFDNPAGNLYVTARELNRLRGRVGQAAGSLVLTSHVRVPLDRWNYQPPLVFGVPVGIQWMRLFPEQITLTVGAEQNLTVLAATIFDYEDRTNYAIFTTSDPTIATVTNEGVVTGIGAGTATITASYEGLTDTCTVTVS